MKEISKLYDIDNIEYALVKGIDSQYIDSLIEVSRLDPEIATNFAHDMKRRFSDVTAATKYLATRQVYLMIDQQKNLAGAIWFRKKHWPIEDKKSPSHTCVIRIYHGHRGRGLAKQFVVQSIKDYVHSRPDGYDGMWLDTEKDNDRAISLYSKIGWIRVKGGEKHTAKTNRVVMKLT